MGNEASRPHLYHRISRAIPPFSSYGGENSEWVDKGIKAFASDGDRDQFIYGLMSLMTSNGSLNLESHTFKLLFTRRQAATTTPSSPPMPPPHTTSPRTPWHRGAFSSAPPPDDGTRLVATLVAIDETGVIKVKIEPAADGRDVGEAFRAFKKDVEFRLERLLESVPDGTAGAKGRGREEDRASRDGGGGGARGPAGGNGVGDRGDAPPAYRDVKG